MDFTGTLSSVSKALGMSPKRAGTFPNEPEPSQVNVSTHGYNTRSSTSRRTVAPSQDQSAASAEQESMMSVILSMKASMESFQASVQSQFQAIGERLNVLEMKRSSRHSSVRTHSSSNRSAEESAHDTATASELVDDLKFDEMEQEDQIQFDVREQLPVDNSNLSNQTPSMQVPVLTADTQNLRHETVIERAEKLNTVNITEGLQPQLGSSTFDTIIQMMVLFLYFIIVDGLPKVITDGYIISIPPWPPPKNLMAAD